MFRLVADKLDDLRILQQSSHREQFLGKAPVIGHSMHSRVAGSTEVCDMGGQQGLLVDTNVRGRMGENLGMLRSGE